MHGIVLMELKKYVEHRYGPATWSALLVAADLPGRIYSAMGEYPDEEVLDVVRATADATGATPDQVLQSFGRFLAPELIATYGFLVQPAWDAFDLIEHTEQAIHTVVRTRDGATPPALEVTRLRDDLVTVRYSSPRRLCALARGMLLGVGDRFRTPLEVTESACTRTGSASCLLEVARVRVVPPAPRTAPDRSDSRLPLR